MRILVATLTALSILGLAVVLATWLMPPDIQPISFDTQYWISSSRWNTPSRLILTAVETERLQMIDDFIDNVLYKGKTSEEVCSELGPNDNVTGDCVYRKATAARDYHRYWAGQFWHNLETGEFTFPPQTINLYVF